MISRSGIAEAIAFDELARELFTVWLCSHLNASLQQQTDGGAGAVGHRRPRMTCGAIFVP